MEFTPEQLTAISIQVEKRIGELTAASQAASSAMDAQYRNSLSLQLSNQQAQKEIQDSQNSHALEIQSKQAKLAAIQLAQSTLISNRNNQPIEAREVSADDIAVYAATLMNYINS